MMSPNRLPLREVSQTLGEDVEVFVCSSSYEARCLSIPLEVRPGAIRDAVILENMDIPEVRKNGNRLGEHFGAVGRRVEVDTGNPIASANAMFACLSPLLEKPALARVAVDITTFTHEHLLILLGMLRSMGCRQILCLYSGASAYMTGQSQWLSEGIAETRSVLGYPGDLGVGSGSKLVMLIGFEWERARRLIDAYDPTELALGLGRRVDAIEEKYYWENKGFYDLLVREYPDAARFEFSCNDARATAKIVAQQCAEEELSPVVAPLNTKISTVGAALAAFDDRRIQICYAQAAVYNCLSYSSPGKYFSAFEVEFAPSQ